MAGNTIYTDLSGTGYDLPSLQEAWQTPSFKNDPANARVGDILGSYAPATSDSGGSLYTTAGYTMPAPGPNASAPRPSVDPSGVYTDSSGNTYDPPSLQNAWANNAAFKNDPLNARVPDILSQYGLGGTAAPAPAAPAPTDGGTARQANVYAAAPLPGAASTTGTSTGTDTNPNAYTPPPIAIDPATTANNQALRDFMTSQLGQLSTPMDVNNPEVKPAIDAFNAQQQRDLQTNRDATAERYYASSPGGGALDSGGFNTAVQQQQEAAAADKANFSGSTIYNAAQAQRQQLQAMLNTAVQAGQTDVAQQIQAQIANIDAGLREQGLGQQNTQFNNTLDYNYANLIAQMNRDALIAGLTGQ